MNFDRLTIERLVDLEISLNAAAQYVRRTRLASLAGDISPDDASALLSVHVGPLATWGEADVKAIFRNSLPVAKEAAPPVPQRLADEISAAHLRATPAARPPRFFRETSTGMTWEFRNGKMTICGQSSIFLSPADILASLDVIEVDEDGNPLEPSAADIAAERGDHEQQREADES